MNHRSPLQLKDGSGWHMCTTNSRVGIWPVGYCRDHGGHETELAARECFAQFERDNVTLDAKLSWTSCYVNGCEQPAERGARIKTDAYAMAALCERHLTMEDAIVALGLDGPAGDAWFS